MNIRTALGLAAVSLSVALCGCASSDKSDSASAEQPITRSETVEVDVNAKVMWIDHASRLATLRYDDGHEFTIRVDEKVKRLNEVRAGDDVRARYRATLLAELRPPTAAERAEPILVSGSINRASGAASPAATLAQSVRLVTTVEAVDVTNMLVTLRGPSGHVAVVRGKNPDNVKKLRVGDTIVVTYSETVAIALHKLAPR